MRVTMYSHDYEPIAVLASNDQDIDLLRRGAGNHFQVMHPGRVQYQLRADPVAANFRHFSMMLIVEGMRWADDMVRPILVLRGAPMRELIDEGMEIVGWAGDIYRTACNAAREQLGRYGGQRSSYYLDEAVRLDPRLLREMAVAPDPGFITNSGLSTGSVAVTQTSRVSPAWRRINEYEGGWDNQPPGTPPAAVPRRLDLSDLERAAQMLDAQPVPTRTTIPRVRRRGSP